MSRNLHLFLNRDSAKMLGWEGHNHLVRSHGQESVCSRNYPDTDGTFSGPRYFHYRDGTSFCDSGIRKNCLLDRLPARCWPRRRSCHRETGRLQAGHDSQYLPDVEKAVCLHKGWRYHLRVRSLARPRLRCGADDFRDWQSSNPLDLGPEATPGNTLAALPARYRHALDAKLIGKSLLREAQLIAALRQTTFRHSPTYTKDVGQMQ